MTYDPIKDSPYLIKRAKKAGVSVDELRLVYKEMGAKKSSKKGFGSKGSEFAREMGEKGKQSQRNSKMESA